MIIVRKYKDLNVLVLGYGIVGKATSKSLNYGGAKVLIWDDEENKREEAKKDGYMILNSNSDFPFEKISALIVSPGIPHLYPNPHKFIKIALKKNIEIDNDISLFFQSYQKKNHSNVLSKIVCVTGTNGKSSSCNLVNHILLKAGFDCEIGGNFGKSALSMSPIRNDSIKILEISSFQAEIAKVLKPDISALVNFSVDHLDRHSGVGGYFAAKSRLFINKKTKNIVINVNNFEGQFIENRFSKKPKKKNNVIAFSIKRDLKKKRWGVFLENDFLVEFKNGFEIFRFNISDLKFFNNKYDYENLFVSYSICRLLDVSSETILKNLNEYSPLKHRNQFLGSVKGINFVNDSKATNFSSAIKSIHTNKNIRLILGGKSKSENILEFVKHFEDIKKIYLIGSTSIEFSKFLSNFSYDLSHNLKNATILAFKESKIGDTILLAPGCSSFDQFKNFEERGEEFIKIFENLKKTHL